MLKWEVKETEYQKKAVLYYKDKKLLEIDWYDKDNCGVWSNHLSFLFQYTPDADTLNDLMKECERIIRDFCVEFNTWTMVVK